MEQQKAHGFSDLRDVWQIVIRRKWLIILPFVLVAALTYAGSYLLTPEYESSTIVAVNPSMPLSGELQRLLGGQDGIRRSAEDTRNELRSYYNEISSMQYVNLLSERLNLGDDAELQKEVRKIHSEHPEIPEQQIKLDLLQEDLRDRMTVTFAARDHIMITVTSPSPQMAQAVSTNLGNIFVEQKLKQEMTSLRSSQDFSDVQLEKYETMLQEKINEKTNFEKRLLGVQLDVGVVSEQNRLNVQSEIDQTNADISDLEKQERDLQAQLARTAGSRASSLTLRESSDLAQSKGELNSQLNLLSSYVSKYPWSDAQVINVKLKQNNIVKAIEAEQRRLTWNQFESYDDGTKEKLSQLFNVRANLDFLYSKSIYLKSALDELTEKTQLGPEYQATLDRLNQEIASATELRDKFKNQQASSTISQALLKDMSSSKYRVVEPGKLPLEPVKPNRIKILLMGLALGIMIGGATAIVVELLDTSFKKVEDVEHYLGLPVLGVAPKVEFMTKVVK